MCESPGFAGGGGGGGGWSGLELTNTLSHQFINGSVSSNYCCRLALVQHTISTMLVFGRLHFQKLVILVSILTI